MRFQKLVFLDFDGVLHPGLAGTFIYLPDFEDCLRALPDVGIVVSSTWRLNTPLHELLYLFSSDIRPRIVGVTSEISEGPAIRYREIQAWTKANSFTGSWVALDDDVSLFPQELANLVLCNPARGLRRPQLRALAEKLA